MVVALARELRNTCIMSSSRAAVYLFLPLLLAALPLSATTLIAPVAAAPGITLARTHRTPATPLEEIPVYSLGADAPQALRSLEAEIERLYVHAKSMPSGPARWEFQTRIHALEKELTPLAKSFDAERWELLRAAVKREWLAVQATLPTALPPAAAAKIVAAEPAKSSAVANAAL
jgi:hypothetical protein